jgi:hypothetical protein
MSAIPTRLGRYRAAVDGWCTSHGNIELMPKKQVLDFKPAPRPEQISGKRREQTEDRKHHVE